MVAHDVSIREFREKGEATKAKHLPAEKKFVLYFAAFVEHREALVAWHSEYVAVTNNMGVSTDLYNGIEDLTTFMERAEKRDPNVLTNLSRCAFQPYNVPMALVVFDLVDFYVARAADSDKRAALMLNRFVPNLKDARMQTDLFGQGITNTSFSGKSHADLFYRGAFKKGLVTPELTDNFLWFAHHCRELPEYPLFDKFTLMGLNK